LSNYSGFESASLNEMLVITCNSFPDDVFLIYQNKDFTFNDLKNNSLKYADFLRKMGVVHGDKVSIVLDNCPEFFFSFFGILFAGATVVTISPKSNYDRISKVYEHSNSKMMIMDEKNAGLLRKDGANDGKINFAALNELNSHDIICDDLFFPDGNDIAFLQYTSGTTGFSKGVMISHKAVLSNLAAIAERENVIPGNDVFSSLMPLYHDMGLIGYGLLPIYTGCKLVLYKQDIRNIYGWLSGFSQYKVTISGASNTILYLTRRVVNDPSEYDLSSLRLLICGSEPIFPQNIKNFEIDYKIKNVIVPAYGLAEISLCATMSYPGESFFIDEKNNIVSCGKPLFNVDIKILKNDGSDIGEVLIRTPSVMTAYFNNESDTKTAFDGDYLKTGDLGYVNESGELFIYGRIKDIIIKDGVNYSPSELEEYALKNDAIRNACVFGITDFVDGNREHVYMVTEIKTSLLNETDELKNLYDLLIKKQFKDCSYLPDKLYFFSPGVIPFSPNGKMQRLKMKEMIINGEYKNYKHVIF
jgi:long-chain acyl-CoA synthetase